VRCRLLIAAALASIYFETSRGGGAPLGAGIAANIAQTFLALSFQSR
jgi:hypothetical protein